ncbi:hypothetical protein KRP22_006962 [Phytophthora ramorum]|nr:hypothetical protein KRP22_1941 [Phytophthora ramorum]
MHKVDPLPTDSEEREIELEDKLSYLAASSPAVPDLESNDKAAQEQRQSVTKSEGDLSEYKGGANVIRYVLCYRREVYG